VLVVTVDALQVTLEDGSFNEALEQTVQGEWNFQRFGDFGFMILDTRGSRYVSFSLIMSFLVSHA
jgi:hypothetical protein